MIALVCNLTFQSIILLQIISSLFTKIAEESNLGTIYTTFIKTRLDGADLSNAILKSVDLGDVILSNEKYIGPQMAGIRWEDVDFSLVDWSQIAMLGDDHVAQQQKEDSKVKGKDERLKEYKTAVRANRQLAVALQTQGLNEDAARFAYRAQLLQKTVFWLQMLQLNIAFRKRTRAFGAWLFSWFLFLLAGYGYKPGRSFLAYLLVIGAFMALYLHLDPHLARYEAVVVSMTAFHLAKVRQKDEQGNVTDMSSMSAVRSWIEGSETSLATRVSYR